MGYRQLWNADEHYPEMKKLKAYCAEHKVVLVCPKDRDVESLVKTYQYLFRNHLEVNILRDEIAVCGADEGTKKLAADLATWLLEEYDAEVEQVAVEIKKNEK